MEPGKNWQGCQQGNIWYTARTGHACITEAKGESLRDEEIARKPRGTVMSPARQRKGAKMEQSEFYFLSSIWWKERFLSLYLPAVWTMVPSFGDQHGLLLNIDLQQHTRSCSVLGAHICVDGILKISRTNTTIVILSEPGRLFRV